MSSGIVVNRDQTAWDMLAVDMSKVSIASTAGIWATRAYDEAGIHFDVRFVPYTGNHTIEGKNMKKLYRVTVYDPTNEEFLMEDRLVVKPDEAAAKLWACLECKIGSDEIEYHDFFFDVLGVVRSPKDFEN